MIKYFLLFAFVSIQFAVQAQKIDQPLLTSHAWKIKTDGMSGIGSHKSLPEDTELVFSKDFTWKSTNAIDGISAGSWSAEKNGELILMTSDKDRSKKLTDVVLTKEMLVYKIKTSTATYTYTWEVK
jgi:hypothetical protein